MQLSQRLSAVLHDALAGNGPGQDECAWLLSHDEHSLEADAMRAVASQITRRRLGNEGIILGQVGMETFPCPANCKFCVFGEKHSTFPKSRMTIDEVVAHAQAFTATGELYAFFLMVMHEFDSDYVLSAIRSVREAVSVDTQIVMNIGDFDAQLAKEMKAAGASGAYHVRRLRERIDSGLTPEARVATIEAIKNAGLDWYYCCEPIGPEHTPEELAEQIFLGVEYECFQHAAMRRVWLPNSPLAQHGQISELRLAQVVAVVTLAMVRNPRLGTVAVHEPNLIGLVSGVNTVYAECGANPRDEAPDTSRGRGRDIADCRKMLYESGYTKLLVSPGAHIPISHTAPIHSMAT